MEKILNQHSLDEIIAVFGSFDLNVRLIEKAFSALALIFPFAIGITPNTEQFITTAVIPAIILEAFIIINPPNYYQNLLSFTYIKYIIQYLLLLVNNIYIFS